MEIYIYTLRYMIEEWIFWGILVAIPIEIAYFEIRRLIRRIRRKQK